jgi:hypothetical protein
VSWDEPGEWVTDPVKKLHYSQMGLGNDDDPATLILVVKYDAGAEVGVHYHGCDYCSIVVEGSIEVTRRVHGVGSMRFVKANTAYGPLKAGPEGCTVIDVFATGRADPSQTAQNVYL